MGIFYLPKDGVCGDFIPYYNSKRKCYELYYLHDYRRLQWRRRGNAVEKDYHYRYGKFHGRG